jgi:hypothetical protein
MVRDVESAGRVPPTPEEHERIDTVQKDVNPNIGETR